MNIMLPDDPSADELPQIDADPPLIQTPVIRMQDLEHAASPANRVSNKGVEVVPRRKDDEAVQAGLEQLEALEKQQRSHQAG